MWLLGREMEKDDIRFQDDAVFRLFIAKACDIEWKKYSEDNVYGITYLLMHSFLKAIKFQYKSKKTTLIDLDLDIILSGITSEVIAYYAYKGNVDYTDTKAYVIAEAKYNLLGKIS